MRKISRRIAKLCLITFATLMVFALVFFLIQKKPKELDGKRVALIDSIGNNHIFRGSNPFVTKDKKSVFAYDELTTYFNGILSQQGREPLQDYYLIDVSLLDMDEYYEIEKEEKFFSEHPEYGGEMLNISTLSPSLLFERLPDSNATVRYIAKSYSLWMMSTLKKIRDMASQQRDRPVVIYIHCDGGRDRTGLLAASYRLLFKNMNLPQVKSKNISEVGRSSEDLYNQAIYSYCLHVQSAYRKASDYCVTTTS